MKEPTVVGVVVMKRAKKRKFKAPKIVQQCGYVIDATNSPKGSQKSQNHCQKLQQELVNKKRAKKRKYKSQKPGSAVNKCYISPKNLPKKAKITGQKMQMIVEVKKKG